MHMQKLLGKNLAPSRNLPGVTRSLRWVRISGGKRPDHPPPSLSSSSFRNSTAGGAGSEDDSDEGVTRVENTMVS